MFRLPLAVLLCCSAFLTSRAPGADAAAILQELNLARTAPSQYADHLQAEMADFRGLEGGRAVAEALAFLRRARPLPPLALSLELSAAAGDHVRAQGPRGGVGHGSMGGRMRRHGRFLGMAGENISYGKRDARSIVCQLIVDDGVRSRGHRKNIFQPGFRVAGIAAGPHARFGAMCVLDFAGEFVGRRTAGR